MPNGGTVLDYDSLSLSSSLFEEALVLAISFQWIHFSGCPLLQPRYRGLVSVNVPDRIPSSLSAYCLSPRKAP
jgi:hypothetical protein